MLRSAPNVLDNVMIGGTISGSATFAESLLHLPRHISDETALRARALAALDAVGLAAVASVRSDRLQHGALRFLEIARALMLRPAFLLLDEPAAGLSAEEILRLGALIRAIAQCGTGVLLVEHHADLIFDICDRVTVLNLGKPSPPGRRTRSARTRRWSVPISAADPAPLLSVSGLCAGYGKIRVLNGVNLTVAPARSSPCSAPTAPEKPPCCAPSPASSPPTSATSLLPASRCAASTLAPSPASASSM
jgi:ABC-type branched-subunit amino acid transport system ATPase component